ncbi:MAG: PKD domain-containing protein, partial [Pirellulales bacterium]|nr:PKD domain-containing protein [Pirellulales bacterium]
FLGFSNGTIQVYDRSGNLNRDLSPSIGGIFGLGSNEPVLDDAHRVTVTARDVLAGLDFGNKLNEPPVAVAGGPYSVNEGEVVVLDASASSDPEQEASTLTYLWDLDGDGTFGETGADAALGDEVGINPTFLATELDGPSSVEVVLRVIDDQGLSSQDTAVVDVLNVAPVIDSIQSSATLTEKALPGDVVTVSGTFSDAGSLDTHTATISWDDGTSSVVTINPADGTFTAEHSYSTGGIFEVIVTLTDDDSGVTSAKVDAVATGVRLTDEGELQVVGTDSKDIVVVSRLGSRVGVLAALGLPGGPGQPNPDVLLRSFDIEDVGSVHIVLCEGNDHATVGIGSNHPFFRFTIPTLLEGGDGNDHLTGGGGDDLILGGTGNDTLRGRGGNDVLVGGDGNDKLRGDGALDLLFGGQGADDLNGGKGEDVLHGGSTLFDQDLDALVTLRSKWTSGTDYDDRVDRITSGPGPNLVAGTTALDDESEDKLRGGRDLDLFFANLAQDRLKDDKSDEVVFSL